MTRTVVAGKIHLKKSNPTKYSCCLILFLPGRHKEKCCDIICRKIKVHYISQFFDL